MNEDLNMIFMDFKHKCYHFNNISSLVFNIQSYDDSYSDDPLNNIYSHSFLTKYIKKVGYNNQNSPFIKIKSINLLENFSNDMIFVYFYDNDEGLDEFSQYINSICNLRNISNIMFTGSDIYSKYNNDFFQKYINSNFKKPNILF